MHADAEGSLAVVASLLVLLAAMLDPTNSASLAVAILAAAGISRMIHARQA